MEMLPPLSSYGALGNRGHSHYYSANTCLPTHRGGDAGDGEDAVTAAGVTESASHWNGQCLDGGSPPHPFLGAGPAAGPTAAAMGGAGWLANKRDLVLGFPDAHNSQDDRQSPGADMEWS